MNNKVSVVKCDRYSEVQNAVENAVSLIGGIGKFVKKGDNVVIKPNLVSKKKPEEAVTTNDLPPKFLRSHPRTSKKPLFSTHIVNDSSVTVRQVLTESKINMYSDVYRFFIHIFGLYTWHLQIYKSNEQSPKKSHIH